MKQNEKKTKNSDEEKSNTDTHTKCDYTDAEYGVKMYGAGCWLLVLLDVCVCSVSFFKSPI